MSFDTIEVWIKRNPIHIDKSKYILRANLYKSYMEYWRVNWDERQYQVQRKVLNGGVEEVERTRTIRVKWVGKNTFYRKMEELYKVQAVKIAGVGTVWKGLSLEN